jgi:hypothetical protein
VLFDGDHSSLAELALLNLDLADAIGSLTEGAIVWADFCEVLNLTWEKDWRELPMR